MVRLVTAFPYGVREVSHCEIELADGVRLATRLWMPEGVTQPVPALLEYLPYRKGDGTVIDDATRHRFFAGHGFVSVRVDIRGSGDSDGVLEDEYSVAELADAVHVIAWLADQPWCNGRVGMLGISWGGFNALQVAALAPPALHAVISVCSTDDRYADDVHYMGSAVLARDMLGWAMTLLAFNARPPDPATVGERWRTMWQQRLDATPAFIDRWLGHSQRDDYWRRGSVCENYAAIRVPVLVVGGWADGYTNSVLRLLDGLDARSRGIIGPWGHQWPHMGRPGPAIDFLGEAVRWWDHWLNEQDRGVANEPKLRLWLQRHTPPQPKRWPGQWLGSDLLPQEFGTQWMYLDGAGAALVDAPGVQISAPLPTDPLHGSAAGAWCPFGPSELAIDQAADDARCLIFDTKPLTDAVTLLGRPVVELDVAPETGEIQLVARLCEVTPDGRSLLLAWGVCQQLPQRAMVRVELNVLGHRLQAGHRLRLALAGCYWPEVWPLRRADAAPERLGSGRLMLPIWHSPDIGVSFEEAQCAEPARYEVLRSGSVTALAPVGSRVDAGRIRHANGIEVDSLTEDELHWSGAAARARSSRRIEMARGGWCTRIEVSGEMTDVAGGVVVSVDLRAFENDASCAERQWRFRFERPSR